MPCAYRSHDDEGCQFRADETLTAIEGQEWCRFHLPSEAKTDWSEEEVEAFNGAVFTLIDIAITEQREANLVGIVFPGDISFFEFQSKVLPAISFDDATFSGLAYFNGAQFGGRASFSRAMFGGTAAFHGTRFGNEAIFLEATFNGVARFSEAHFGGSALFSSSTFRYRAEFREARFGKDTGFEDVTFGGDADFSGKEPSDNDPHSFRYVNFGSAKFEDSVWFINRRFLDKTYFHQAEFLGGAPEFHGCVVHQDTDFSGAIFGSRCAEDAPAYRTLKLAMEETRARNDQAMFFALEQECLRKDSNTPGPVRFASWLYFVTADYGQSLLRPFIGFFSLLVIAYLIYLAVLTGNMISCSNSQTVLWFTLQQVFLPFQAFKMSGPDSAPVGLAFVAAIHSLLNFGFLALFILALRRRFKMG